MLTFHTPVTTLTTARSPHSLPPFLSLPPPGQHRRGQWQLPRSPSTSSWRRKPSSLPSIAHWLSSVSSALVAHRATHFYRWSRYEAPCCILNQMETWTTTRWELEHKIVQGGIEPLRLKSHQALNFKMKCNLLSCFLPDFGIVIYDWTIYNSNRMIGE